MKHSYPQYIDYPQQETALSLWRGGDLVVIPTETVYGLGADAHNGEAVAKIYALKSRPSFNPLIAHVASATIAQRYGVWNDWAETLSRFWPGPLTLVLRHAGGISDLARAGGETVALRVPNHPATLALLQAFNGPIAAPSANQSGRISPTTPQHVREEFGAACPLIIEGGACEIGLESTVVDISGDAPVLLRAGAITREMLEKALGQPLAQSLATQGELKSPGMLASHYAPQKPLRLHATHAEAGEGLLAFGHAPHAEVIEQLSEHKNLNEAAANLFAALRRLDANPKLQRIACMPIPATGIGEAINDRLSRAAARKE